jgi:hypothetical protein
MQAEVAKTQQPLIDGGPAGRDSLGTMSAERWKTLIGQLKNLGDIAREIPAGDCYRNL